MNKATTRDVIFIIFASLSSATKLTIYPQQAIKGKPVALTCEAEPPTDDVTYIWIKNGHKVANLTTSKWTIEEASLDTRSFISCITETKKGAISQADMFVNVVAFPSFIMSLKPHYGFSYTNTNISLTCIIECYPPCNIVWYEEDAKIDTDNPLYNIKEEIVPADDQRNNFESFKSTLVWNLKNWPNQCLNKTSSPSHYTCKSESFFRNVNSTTYFEVEYPPENITLSTKTVVNVTENETPDPVICTAEGNPKVDYVWKHTPTGFVEGIGKSLNLSKLSRFEEHNYTCEASNKHGVATTELNFNVLYKPSCFIELETIDEKEALVCKPDGNPRNFTFQWNLTYPDKDVHEDIINKDSYSYLILNSTKRNLKNYECHVNNSVGVGTPCTKAVSSRPFQIDLTGIAGDVEEGMHVRLKCEVKATFMVQIRWYNNSKRVENTEDPSIATVSTNKSDIITSSSMLKFTASRHHDHASVKCSGTNKFLEDHDIPLEKTLRLEVLYKPIVTVTSIQTTFVEDKNQTAVLFCNYDANPLKPVTANWLKNGEVLTRIEGKHTFVTLSNLSLIIAYVTREDIGNYSCLLSNSVGNTTSESLTLDVLYSPTMEVTMTSSLPSTCSFKTGNITLSCNVTSGNPLSLSKIYWFVNDSLLEDYITQKLYQPQLEKVLLTNESRVVTLIGVSENYVKNFMCQGVNQVGPGPKSKPLEVKISYPDIPTKIIQKPETVFKGDKVTLECSVEGDRPSNITYVWLKNKHRLLDVHTSKWTIKQASVQLRKNISCFGTSGKRTSTPAKFSADIKARANFLTKPSPYTGVLKSSRFVSLTCRVECSPLCPILWITKDQVISTDALYNISRTEHAADFLLNDFESVESTLTFSRDQIRDDTLDIYSCRSVSQASHGPDVNASTIVTLEHPPEDVKVSEIFVDVKENHVPKAVKCEGKGKPRLNYVWRKASTKEVVAVDDTLVLGRLSKSEEGNYTCEGYNKHGNQSANVYFHVSHYKPICSITFGNLGMQRALICSADTDTQGLTFTWKANSSGSLQSINGITIFSRSFYTLNENSDNSKSYICLVKNSVGEGTPCETFLPRPPSFAKIDYFPSEVSKKSNATIQCSVHDPGFPKNLTYMWFLNHENVHNSSRSTWNISSVSLEDRNSTFMCLVANEASFSMPSEEISLNIVAPPRFIETPPSSLSVYYESENVTLTCRVECYPECSITWLKNGEHLELDNNEFYDVENDTYDADDEEGLFESVESILVWNMTLNKNDPVSKYTCVSTSANEKSKISFTSVVTIEFAPENLTVSDTIVDVVEDEIPSPVECGAKGQPLNYVWTKNSSGEVVSKSEILQLEKLSKLEGGYYTCTVSNKYGTESIDVYFNIFYAPTCKVSFNRTTNSLTCSGEGNPPDISYTWQVRSAFDTTVDESKVVNSEGKSMLILTDEVMRRDLVDYQCLVNNPIGRSQPCTYSNDTFLMN